MKVVQVSVDGQVIHHELVKDYSLMMRYYYLMKDFRVDWFQKLGVAIGVTVLSMDERKVIIDGTKFIVKESKMNQETFMMKEEWFDDKISTYGMGRSSTA